ncbi:MAG: amidohydrolase family protein [Pyrinomonadaceae bacterium]
MEKLKILFSIIFLLTLSQTIFCSKKSVDLIISGGTVVTMDAEKRLIENGAVAVQKGEIVAVGKTNEISRQFVAKQIINANGKVVIPGLVNTHTHIPMTLFRGISDDLDLQEWLTKYHLSRRSEKYDGRFCARRNTARTGGNDSRRHNYILRYVLF